MTEAVFQDWGRRRDERQRRRELQELVRADLADICRQIEAIVGHLAAAGFRISDFGFRICLPIRNPQSAIRNPPMAPRPRWANAALRLEDIDGPDREDAKSQRSPQLR